MDQNLERKINRHILKNPTNALLAADRLSYQSFRWSTAGTLFRCLVWWVRNYNTSPNSTELASVLVQHNINEELAKSVSVLYSELILETPDDSTIGYLVDQMLSYEKKNLVENALRKSVELLSENKLDGAVTTLKTDLANIDKKFKIEQVRSGTLDVDIDRLLWEYEDKKLNPSKYERLKIGFPSIDRAMKGLPNGSLYLIIAPWKGFKSTLLKCIAVNLAKRGLFVYLHSNEDTRETFHARVAATELKIPFANILDKELSVDEETRWKQFLEDSRNNVNPIMNNIHFDEVLTSSTAQYISNKVQELNKVRKVDAILIDHFGRMQPNDKRNMPMWEKMSEISQQLALTALDLRLPMLMTAHSNLQGTKDAKEDGKNIAPEDLGLSSQPLKEVSGAFSFVIENLESFKANGNKGYAKLALNLSRYSADAFSTLSVDGVISEIKELQLGGMGSTSV